MINRALGEIKNGEGERITLQAKQDSIQHCRLFLSFTSFLLQPTFIAQISSHMRKSYNVGPIVDRQHSTAFSRIATLKFNPLTRSLLPHLSFFFALFLCDVFFFPLFIILPVSFFFLFFRIRSHGVHGNGGLNRGKEKISRIRIAVTRTHTYTRTRGTTTHTRRTRPSILLLPAITVHGFSDALEQQQLVRARWPRVSRLGRLKNIIENIVSYVQRRPRFRIPKNGELSVQYRAVTR